MSDKMSYENALTFVGTRLAMNTHTLAKSTDALTRKAAKDVVLGLYPKARFFR